MKRLSFLGLILIAGTTFAQVDEFGKNKVQYRNFDWYFIQSKHFDVYFYPQEYYLAEFTAQAAEAAYSSISEHFHYDITSRIPIVIYDSHNDWQQTNVVSEYLEEGVGGVTELFKNRVVVPFEGSYRLLRHVIHHELVHAVINDMYYGGSIQSIIANNITMQIPMWFNEGLAEYESLGWDANSDIFMLDATVNEYLVPIEDLNGYFAYRGGQSVWYYIARRYGDEKIGEILSRIRTTRSVEQGFKSALGITIKELSRRWTHEQKVLYWPEIATRKRPEDFATRLTDHKEIGNFYNTSPAISPQGDRIACISDRDDYMSIYLINAGNGKVIKKLVDGQTTKNFEELHLLTPGLTWSPDGKKVAIAVKSGAHDAIFMIDVQTDRMEKVEFPDLAGVFSVTWSPGGERLAFIGQKGPQSDVYVYDIANKKTVNITNDIFSESDPSWSPDGKTIYFASDRGPYLDKRQTGKEFRMWNHNFNRSSIYSISVASGIISRVSKSDSTEESYPVAAPDGKHLYYISDKSGITNIYDLNFETGRALPATNSLSGITQFSISSDGSRLAFSTLENGGFDIFVLRSPGEHLLNDEEVPLTVFMKGQVAERDQARSRARKPLHAGVALDSAQVTDSTKVRELYGKDIQVDLSNYVFGGRRPAIDSLFEAPNFNENFNVKDNVDSTGNFVAQKYKVSFSPDIIYGNAGYNSLFGVQGSTVMAFSDMLGNHQIFLLTDLVVDLKNSDYAFAYTYLPSRINYSIVGSHFAHFLYLSSQYTGYYDLYRFQTSSVSLSAEYPFDRFNRLEAGLSWMSLTRENLMENYEPNQERTLIVPTLNYVHDNSFFGYIAPINGSRYILSLYGTPKTGSQGIDFLTGAVDYRSYVRLSSNFYTFVWRVFAGTSIGSSPQKFFIGGTENWINVRFNGDFIPVRNAEDLEFLTPVVPMRGYDYNAKFGNNFALLNMELRFPMFGFLSAGPLPLFQTFFGTTFVDVGSAWGWDWNNRYVKFQPFDYDNGGRLKTRDLLVGTGVGVRMVILYFLLRLDVAWAFNMQSFSPPRYYFSLGYDF